MTYLFIDQLKTSDYMAPVWEILCECDNDFLPPLSSRESSKQMNLQGLESKAVLPKSYYERMIEQKFILVLNELNDLVAFMTFIHAYECPELEVIGPSNYITTICVTKTYRQKGILKQLYTFMKHELPEPYVMPYISTRTWSQNTYHLLGLERQGFEAVKSLKDHRGPGIDTIYFGYRV